MDQHHTSSKLTKLMYLLEGKRNNSDITTYRVPDLWNTWGYSGSELTKSTKGELFVNPYNFYYEVIHSYILPKKQDDLDYTQPHSQMTNRMIPQDIGGDWIKESVVYSMIMRTSSAWDHDLSHDLESNNQFGLNETGTFVKSLVLLPLLKKMGVDVVYLLPISKFSLKDKKGELGSPYGVSNFYQLDPSLKDAMTGDSFTVEDEFEAFVEACHILGMKVMIDIIPRTNAIENDLIIDHPDWFYWIKSACYDDYYPPKVPTLGFTSPKPEYLMDVYKSKDVWKHIRKFSYDPKTIDPILYQQLKDEARQTGVSFSDLVKRDYKIQIAPAFSDQINDTQPPWTDITFFRMYQDHPVLSQVELDKVLHPLEELPPYILFDTIKCNYYEGLKPNMELWQTLSDIIPYYQERFGIDGARIDMGHALSADLLDLIISKARQYDPHFCFIAEELDVNHAKMARDRGYNMIIGAGFMDEPRFKERKLHAFMYGTYRLDCPVFACGETHDTPRLASREGGRVLANMLTLLNMFVPNAIPFINSGQEVYERQPINTGLDVLPGALYQLEEDDPYYMKLALFDKYAFHYLNEGAWELPNLLEKVASIRKRYLTTLVNVENFIPIKFTDVMANCIGFAYLEVGKRTNKANNILLIFANTDPFHETTVVANIEPVRNESGNTSLEAIQLFSQYDHEQKGLQIEWHTINLTLKPGEVKVIKL